MICPKCHGYGAQCRREWYAGFYVLFLAEDQPCDYPGCHGGMISCCDGLQEPRPATGQTA